MDVYRWNLHAASIIALTPRRELRALVTEVDRPEPTATRDEGVPEPERVTEPIPA
jgi:hypothetical protein